MKSFLLRASLVVLVFCTAMQLASAQDYAREKRWADEIVPGLVVGDAVWLELAGGRKFLGLHTPGAQGPSQRAAVLLVHGIGVHPDHGVIGALRVRLADAGHATLAIQMPVLRADAGANDYFPAVFPEAIERIRAGARWLRDHGEGKVVLLSHSMGSWMSNVYYERTPDAPFAAWICMGFTGGYGEMQNVKVPVLDVYGENDLPNVLRADWRRKATIGAIPGSRQVRIAGADHFYAGREGALLEAIEAFLREREAG